MHAQWQSKSNYAAMNAGAGNRRAAIVSSRVPQNIDRASGFAMHQPNFLAKTTYKLSCIHKSCTTYSGPCHAQEGEIFDQVKGTTNSEKTQDKTSQYFTGQSNMSTAWCLDFDAVLEANKGRMDDEYR